MDSTKELQARVAELEAALARRERVARFHAELDELSEVALRDRLTLEAAMRRWLPALARATGASLVAVRTFDESLALHDFSEPPAAAGDPHVAEVLACASAADAAPTPRFVGAARVVHVSLDVAGEPFGVAALCMPAAIDGAASEEAHALLATWAEAIDHHLAAIAEARLKQRVTRALSEALQDPVLDRGLDCALDVLRAHVRLAHLVLVFRHESDASGDAVRFKLIEGDAVRADSARSEDDDPRGDTAFVRAHALAVLQGDVEPLRARFGIRRYRDELLITGVRSQRVIGRVLATSARGDFNTFDRDLLDRFADALRQRLVDFHREWKALASTFPRDVTARLLEDEGYAEAYLTPRERSCAVLFTDIAGFTRLSEQVLVEPAAIGRLIDVWSARVVEIVWESGGVFDKMVGDCVIAMWGPPFFDEPAASLCHRAADAARRIRAFTRSLSDYPALPELCGATVDVATGLHFCSLMVGVFGPDGEYTGFSSGMNNTARLQGQARGGEILCMDSFVDAHGAPEVFGEVREASVKNVARPLVFRALLDVPRAPGEPSRDL